MNKFSKIFALTAFVVIFAVVGVPEAKAQMPNHDISWLPVDEPLDVGGTVLQPGRYQIKVIRRNPETNGNVVQVLKEDGTVVTTVLTVPHAISATKEQEHSEFIFYPPAAPGAPKALRTWFPADPVGHRGHDFVYPEGRATEIAVALNEPVVTYRGETRTAFDDTTVEVVTPQREITTYVTPNTTTTTTTRTTTGTTMLDEEQELPRTASPLPLAALGGLLLLGAAFGIRRLRNA